MIKPTRKQLLLSAAALLVLAAVVYGFLPTPISVETAVVQRDTLRVTVEEEGETYVEQYYTVSAPVAAFARRISLEPGDTVHVGQPLVELEEPPSAMLDPRRAEEAAARVEAVEASLEQATVVAEQAARERERVARLAAAGSATERELDQAQTEAARALAGRNAARAELAAARAAAAAAVERERRPSALRSLRAPASGRVLVVHRRSEGPVNPGEPLIDIGDTDLLEVQVEVLSRDAVRLAPGMQVEIEQWGGEETLEAIVSRVERQGRVVVSALGVEERRVMVTAELLSPPPMREGLGSGYRVLARFIVWQDDDALQVPAGALFRTDEGWAAFVIEEGRAVRRAVTIGRQAGLAAQVLDGLSEGEVVIVHPASEIEAGVRVEAR